MIISGVMFLIAAGVLGSAGYLVWQSFGDEQARARTTSPTVDEPTTDDELIEQFDGSSRWNGPGAPAFGVGDDQP